MNNWFVIRADASVQIGIGHLMRCLAFSEWATTYNLTPVVITKKIPDFIRLKAKQLNIEVIELDDIENNSENLCSHSSWLKNSQCEDAKQSSTVIQQKINEFKSSPNFILVDHYAINFVWESSLKQLAPILVFDDLNDRVHDCKWLLDQTFGKEDLNYSGLVPKNCQLFVGVKYALLRKEFSELALGLIRTKIESSLNILVTLGGVDKENHSLTLINIIKKKYSGLNTNLTLVVSSSNPNIKILSAFTHRHENIHLLIDVHNMAELMKSNDICIGAVGSTTWERFVMKLPSILCVTAQNQMKASEKLIDKNLIRMLDLNISSLDKQLNNHIEELILDKNYLDNISRISQVTNGLGASLLIDKILESQ
jgi:UDP-2,4-diacetamido-2,4,6-trideoxy-beta-L-altropyranose hydrolase